MPNKTIYVPDADLPVLERAQHFTGGNLSAAISHALRRFVETMEADMEGYEETEVRVGADGSYTRKRFVARRIAHWQRRLDDDRVEYLVVYLTRKKQYALHVKRVDQRFAAADFAALPGEPGPQAGENWQEYWENVTDLDSWGGTGSAELELTVFRDMDELKAAVPPDLGRLAEQGARQQAVEELDI